VSIEQEERERHIDGTPLRIARVATGTYTYGTVCVLFRSRLTSHHRLLRALMSASVAMARPLARRGPSKPSRGVIRDTVGSLHVTRMSRLLLPPRMRYLILRCPETSSIFSSHLSYSNRTADLQDASVHLTYKNLHRSRPRL
jgi:hypothetical protein